MKTEFIEKIYAGWLAKIIGIRLGAPIEGWTYEKIKNVYGELEHYPVDYRDFAADDDSNGPLFFLRALEDGQNGFDLKAQDVAEALLNYASFERGFFWWGGYGISTEHTAYLNLRNGIPAPRSGSIEQNGATMAEQIGGQIFIDTWGLVTPGNPDLAAKYASEAASVTHGGNGIYGGIFVATCISYAFIEKSIDKIIEKGLSYIPSDCEYTKVVRDVIKFHSKNKSDWRACYEFIHANYGYDKYPGNCHIIPNIAVMILSLLYGRGDFSDTLNICNMCGWDTDCNVGNVGTIMGVICGLEGIDYEKWRRPINDFLACSGVLGSMNIMDIPYGASYIAKLAYAVAGEEAPKTWGKIFENHIDSCHFEYPGSTHAIRVRRELTDERSNQHTEYELQNSSEVAHSGTRSLKVIVKPVGAGERVCIFKKTYYRPKDFHDSRYDPSFSPLFYPGQEIHACVYLPEYSPECQASLYAHNARTGESFAGKPQAIKKGEWLELCFQVQCGSDALLDEVGVHIEAISGGTPDITVFIDDFYTCGKPEYTVDFANEEEELWENLHREVSQFTKLKGLLYLDSGRLHLACSDFGETYTGHLNWEDYEAEFSVTPRTGSWHGVNVRVQGAIRSYAAVLLPNGKAAILKNENGYRVLKQADFDWKRDEEIKITVRAQGNKIQASFEGGPTICAVDVDNPYLHGSIGLSVRDGSHIEAEKITVME